MSTYYALLLSLGAVLSPADAPPGPSTDLARLREVLQDRLHAGAQHQAAMLLVQNDSPEALDIVRQGLQQTQNQEVFGALATALRLAHDQRFTEELLLGLASGQPATRQAASETLAELADQRIVERISAITADPKIDRPTRLAAIRVLGSSGCKIAAPALFEQLTGDDEVSKQAAARALEELSGQSFGFEQGKWRSWWIRHKDMPQEEWLAERLAYQGSRSRRLEGELERARAQIVRLHQQLYGRLGVADKLGHVESLADSDDPAVRSLAVAWSNELLPSADAVGQRALAILLLRFSRDADLEVQRAAVLALAHTSEPRAFNRLCVLLQSGRPPVRAAAARALAIQVKGASPEALARQREVVPALQKALDDAALEVVVEAAESLGTLGIPEAGPVLTILLRHPSRPVRQTAAQALERVADLTLLDGILEGLDDPAVTIRFSLVGALSHAVAEGRNLNETQRARLTARLEGLLLRDADPGVRSRAATVLGECGTPSTLPILWRRVLANEDNRIQEKAWAAMVEILVRSGDLNLLREWDHTLVETKQGARRLQLLTEASARWQKKDETRAQAAALPESLVQAQLDQGKWVAAFPLVRELLAAPVPYAELERRLRWLLVVGEQALKEGNQAEALRAVQEAQPFLARRPDLTAEFEKLEKLARQQ